jgi:peroxiredoxin
MLFLGMVAGALVVAAYVLATRHSSPVGVPSAGLPVEDFTLRDFRGRTHSLRELADRPFVVVAFLGTGCPLGRLYGPRLAELAREFEPRDVAFLAVNPNARDSPADLDAYVRTHQISFPILKDADNAVADRLGATRTPEVVVLDPERRIRYQGRIDDQYAAGVRRPAPTRRDLAVALEELLAGRPVSCPVTEASGCLIARAPVRESPGDVTYCRHIARIVQQHCVACHRPGEIGPFPLTGYREAAAWASMIGEVVESGGMPPWLADPRHGRFRNDPRLSEEEKRLLRRWIDGGCPEGDARELPPPPEHVSGWRIPRPDLVLPMAERAWTVPAKGEVTYQYFLADPGFTEDRYVRAAEVRPGSPTVVHHALVLLVPPGGDGRPDPLGALLDYAPGMPPTLLPDGYALRVPAGSKFLFQTHYTPNGSEQQDRSSLGLVFADARSVRHEVRGGAVLNLALLIPPGAADYRLTAEQVVPEDWRLLSLSPHMHLRGKSFRYEAFYPDGGREVLLEVPRYDFNWQLRYELAEPKLLPRGTRLVCTACYDNSPNNPNNPDPSREDGWGEQTPDEMLFGFFAAVPAGP